MIEEGDKFGKSQLIGDVGFVGDIGPINGVVSLPSPGDDRVSGTIGVVMRAEEVGGFRIHP